MTTPGESAEMSGFIRRSKFLVLLVAVLTGAASRMLPNAHPGIPVLWNVIEPIVESVWPKRGYGYPSEPLLGCVAQDFVGNMLTLVLFSASAMISVVVFEVLRVHEPNHRHARCRACGYILHGIAIPRCPECGTPV
ncbi:MAG: hypothetical protein A49_15250 [Methyloceanibacter sp.]|nr:MAG: hypothetical protein A49_15250 [Methyloceanibacter sp.]